MSLLTGTHNTNVNHSHFSNVGQNQYNIIHTHGQNITFSTAENESILSSLEPVDRTGYYVPPCMNGTRKAIFEKVDSWLLDVNAHNILWISGSPGVGKSTIASSLVLMLEGRGRLGASFFFKRGDAALSDPGVVWRTVAFDLAESDPAVARRVVANLKGKKVNPRRPDIELHFQYMVEDPLKYREATAMFDDSGRRDEVGRATDQQQRNIGAGELDQVVKQLENGDTSKKLHPVVVLDALDECGFGRSESASAQRRIFLDSVTNWSRLPAQFKLIVTSRDYDIPRSFRNVCDHIVLDTGDLVSSDANSDVQTFFEKRFADVAASYPSLSQTWPGNSIIVQLTAYAAGLFIWADTVIRFVEQGVANEQLDLLLTSGFREGGDRVDALYGQILDLSFRDCKANIHERFRTVVGAIVLAKAPLRRIDLKRFVGTEENEPSIDFILQKLSPVISIGDRDNIIRVCHLSFTDFMCNSNRLDKPFAISRSTHSEVMALNCLRIMNRQLKFNICGLESSYLRNDEVQDLSTRVEGMIPVFLLYSCRFFIEHLKDITNEKCGVAVVKEIERFLHFHFLYWLEVMSLREWISVAVKVLGDMTQWLKFHAEHLSAFAADARQFVNDFRIPISTSVPHIYLSALPFASSESRVSQCFQPQFSKTLSLPKQGNRWSSLIDKLASRSGYVWSGSFALDERSLASGSGYGTICTWDAKTGKNLSAPLDEHAGWIWSIAFSPDGRRVVSVSGHQKISLLDALTGLRSSSSLDEQTRCITSIAFSPSGRRVVSCSADRTIHIWDAETGKLVSSPPKLHKNYVTSLAFSPDAKRVVSGSWDMTICVWDADTGQALFGPLKGHAGGINSVAFAPNGRHVVSGSDDRTVRIWDAETGKIMSGPLKGHTDQVTSVTFSPNGSLVVSGSDDRTIYIWDAKTGKILSGPLKGHTGPVTSSAFSPSGRHVVSGSVDQTIRVWDAKTGQLVLGPLGGHTGAVSSVAFSPDGRCLVSMAVDQTIRIWDADPTQSIINLHFSDEWMLCNPVTLDDQNCEIQGDSRGLLFWVPPKCRQGICGGETICIMGVNLIRADFSKFVHGMSWEQCHTPDNVEQPSSVILLVPFVNSQARYIYIVPIPIFVVLALSIFFYSHL